MQGVTYLFVDGSYQAKVLTDETKRRALSGNLACIINVSFIMSLFSVPCWRNIDTSLHHSVCSLKAGKDKVGQIIVQTTACHCTLNSVQNLHLKTLKNIRASQWNIGHNFLRRWVRILSVCLPTRVDKCHSLMCVSLCDPHGLSQDVREEMKVTQTFARSLFVILRAKNRHARSRTSWRRLHVFVNCVYVLTFALARDA